MVAGFGSSRLAILSALVVMSGCEKSPEACFPLVGEIDERMERVVEGLAPGTCAIITSPGGRYESAINIASMLNEKNIRLEIGPFCASACFDGVYLLTDQTRVRDGAIILVHESPLLIDTALERAGLAFKDLCMATPMLSDALLAIEMRYPNHKEYADRLIKLIDFKVATWPDKSADCLGLSFSQTAEAWMPTSQELIELGLVDAGAALCADGAACITSFESSQTQTCHWRGQVIPCPNYSSVLASRSPFDR